MQPVLPDDIPALLRERAAQVAARLEDLDRALPAALAGDAARVLVSSGFVLGVLQRQPDALIERLQDARPLDGAALVASLQAELGDDAATEAAVMAAMRRRRNVELARIAWRDIAGQADLEASLADLSTLADAMIRLALERAAALIEPRFGTARNAAGEPQTLLVLGMGKLGGIELNYSSDIDLVFLYPDEVEVTGPQSVDVEAYFRRLAQLFIRLLDQTTEDGFVFRVDTRLRPFGNSGPLAISLSAFEAYLVQHGRDWERYAYVKARLVTGEAYARDVFDFVLTPFVYRRYLDFGVFDALRQMKRLISAEVQRKEMQANIKLGAGGIREIEFIAQVFQLIRGGQEPLLRSRHLLEVLARLGQLHVLEADAVDRLDAAYRYLRTVENRLQALDDQQTHELPADPETRARLAFALGHASWEPVAERVAAARATVETEFGRIAWDPVREGGEPDRARLRLEAWEAGRIEQLLADTPLADNVEVAEQLGNFRRGGLYNRMDEPSRRRLAATVAGLVPILAVKPDPASVLNRVLPILQAICRRSAYLALLNENPEALERLLSLAGQSPMLARQMAEHPLLLDELLDSRLFDAQPSRDELRSGLAQALDNAGRDDIERMLDALRQFQRAAVFRIAIADRLGGLPLMRVSDLLTDTAELVLEFALDIAWRELVARYGEPMHGEPGRLQASGFAVVAYGKLGGLELGYGSDLDLVFLHDSSGSVQETGGPSKLDNQRFFARLVQRLIHFLTIQTSSGRLYEIDTRLRPSGASGFVVSSLTSFRRYQREEAWTWEHQALLRSRAVAGQPALCASFERERRQILIEHVEREGLATAIADMRARMRRELSQGTQSMFDIKQDAGGLADIEFLVDYWVLANATEVPELVTFPDNVRQLEALETAGLVDTATVEFLKQAYLELRARIHELALSDGGKLVPAADFAKLRQQIIAIWDRVFDRSGEAGDN